jgi:predicted Zn-dependent protease
LLEDARRACRESLRLDPTAPLGHLLLGRVELSLGRAANAYEHLARAYASTQRIEEEAQCIAHLAVACDKLAERDASPRMAGYALRFRAALDAAALGPRLRERTLRALAREPDPDRD